MDSFRTILGNPNSSLIPGKPIRLSAFNYTVVDLTAKALQKSPDIHATEAKIAAEKANIIAAQSAYKPQINLELRQDWNGETIGEGLPSNIVALGFQWTLFSGSERSGAVQQAIANAKKVKFELDEQRNQLMLTIRQLKRDETQARYAYRLNQAMIQQQNQVINTLEKRFGKGLVPLNALLESQFKLTQTKIQTIQTLYNQKIIQAHYLMLTNELTRSKSIA